MNSPASLFIVLPAYNEAPALRQLIPDIVRALKPHENPFTICLVDDGSTDGTATLASAFAQEAPLQYLQHEKNRGYGAALKTGFVWAVKNAQPDDVVVCLDADNTHSPTDIPRLLKKLQEGYDVVTASYTLPGGQVSGVPPQRRFFSRCANGLLGLRFRIPHIGTYTNGFRAYRVAALQKAYGRYGERLIEESNFAGGTEVFIKTVRCGARAGEVPFTLHYERRGSDSKIRILRTIFGYLKLLGT